MSSPKVIFGFHAVGVRIKTAPQSVIEVLFDASRRDARMRQFVARAQEAGVRLIEADGLRLSKLAGSHGHQGVAARVRADRADPLARRTARRPRGRRHGAAAAGARRRDRPAQPRRLPARGRWRRRARGDRAQGPCGGHQRHCGQGRERRGRDGALLHGDQPRAHARRAQGTQHLVRGHQRRRARHALPERPEAARSRWCWAPRARACANSRARPATNWCAFRWPVRSRASTSRWRAGCASTRRCGSAARPRVNCRAKPVSPE